MATPAWTNLDVSQRRFLQLALNAAQKCERETGVPACITLAQAILEADWGRHHIGRANNYFGIKAGPGWKGETVLVNTKEWGRLRGWYVVKAAFRRYPDMAASFSDHGLFLRQNRRYRDLFLLDRADYRGWARGLLRAGYATDPGYAEKLIGLIERYGLHYYNLPPESQPAKS